MERRSECCNIQDFLRKIFEECKAEVEKFKSEKCLIKVTNTGGEEIHLYEKEFKAEKMFRRKIKAIVRMAVSRLSDEQYECIIGSLWDRACEREAEEKQLLDRAS